MALGNLERVINIIRDDMKNPPNPPSDLYNERWLKQFENMIRNFQNGRCSRELVIIGGPRRTGKSTILQSILSHFNQNACYLDVERSEVQNALKGSSLTDLVLEINRKLERNIILLDEITSLKEGWEFKVKELWDYIEQREKLFIIVAGSIGVLIKKGSSLLSARRGFCSTRLNGSAHLKNPAVILPAKFGAFIANEIFDYDMLPLKSEERVADLIGLSTGDEKITDRYNGLDPQLTDMLNGDLARYLEMGGYPQLRDAAGEKKALRREIFDSLIKDITYYDPGMEIGTQFLNALRSVAKKAVMLNTDDLKEKFRTLLGASKTKFNENLFYKAKEYFTDSYTLTRLTNDASYKFSHLEKLCINDPTIFWGLYEKDLDMEDQDKLSTAEGLLFEHLVGSHLRRLDPDSSLSFYSDGKQDVDYIMKLKGRTFFIQAAKGASEAYNDLETAKSVSDKLGLEKSYNVSLIMNAEKISKTKKGTVIPASLFLALI